MCAKALAHVLKLTMRTGERENEQAKEISANVIIITYAYGVVDDGVR